MTEKDIVRVFERNNSADTPVNGQYFEMEKLMNFKQMKPIQYETTALF